MPDSTKKTSPITESVTQVTTEVLGDAPAYGMGSLFQAMSSSTGISLQNAVHAQNNHHAFNDAVTVQGVNLLHTSATAATAAIGVKLDAGFEGAMAKLGGLLLNVRTKK